MVLFGTLKSHWICSAKSSLHRTIAQSARQVRNMDGGPCGGMAVWWESREVGVLEAREGRKAWCGLPHILFGITSCSVSVSDGRLPTFRMNTLLARCRDVLRSQIRFRRSANIDIGRCTRGLILLGRSVQRACKGHRRDASIVCRRVGQSSMLILTSASRWLLLGRTERTLPSL